MLCPSCGKELEEVKIPSSSGVVIKTNQCQNCGGVWFNDLDLFSLTGREAKILEEISKNEPRESSLNVQSVHYCPVCGIPLVRLRDTNIPENININNCPKCNGLWMDRGETIKYKEYQKQKKQQSEEKKEEFSGQKKKEEISRPVITGSPRDEAIQETERIIKSLE